MKPGNNRRLFSTLIFITLSSIMLAQEVKVEALNTPLNKLLVEMRSSYRLQISFNDRQLEQYSVSLNATYPDIETAMESLVAPFPLRIERRGDVFLVIPEEPARRDLQLLVAGRVVDALSGEALPFSHMLVNGHGLVTDFKGNFSYVSSSDSLFIVKATYLGYIIKDTLLGPGNKHLVKLSPANIDIKEVVVMGNLIERSVQAGANPGELRINHKVAGYLPGNGDNSVFNLLRLQPGILAAGEQSGDLIIWGAYEGQSKIVFDGFTIFGLRNFNDNISAVNPYLAKDIRVLKGGFGAEYGERVGGIVDITGVDGSTVSPNVNFSINNMTLNGMASLPLAEKSAVLFAFRQTYYDLYDAVNLNLFTASGNRRNTNTDIYVYPDYLFRDLNFKLSGKAGRNDTYFVSLYSGSDSYSYSAEEKFNNTTIVSEAMEENDQKGLAAFYGKSWRGGSVSNLTLSYSELVSQNGELRRVTRGMNDSTFFSRDVRDNTSIGEAELRLDNILPVTSRNTFKFGAGIINDDLTFREDTFGVEFVSDEANQWIAWSYLSDNISITDRLSVEPGLRADYQLERGRVFMQPRLALRLDISPTVKMYASGGLYKQFIALTSVIDEAGNFRYLWNVCDGDEVPVLSSVHYVGGVSYSQNGLIVSAEAYYKETEGLTRYVRTRFFRDIFYGESRSRGVDFLIKKSFSGHTLWAAYSLSQTEEYFPYTIFSDFTPALHDQRHELKGAAIFNVKPFWLSADYVYGSGFPDPTPLRDDDYVQTPYSRLDASVVYKFKRENYFFDAGLSLLNIFNTENLKYSNFVRIPTNQSGSVNLHAEAVPRTLTLFLNLSF